jgi:hypothetical protein
MHRRHQLQLQNRSKSKEIELLHVVALRGIDGGMLMETIAGGFLVMAMTGFCG